MFYSIVVSVDVGAFYTNTHWVRSRIHSLALIAQKKHRRISLDNPGEKCPKVIRFYFMGLENAIKAT